MGTALVLSPPSVGATPPPNAIQVENNLPGTTSWELTRPASEGQIQGYASQTSVAAGETVSISVSTTAPTFRAAIYRMGWYAGLGGRLVESISGMVGRVYPTPTPDSGTGLLQCDWPAAFTLTVPSAWVSGMYAIKLIASTGYESYIPLIVRSSSPSSRFVFVHAATTDEAYNSWGGKSLYRDYSDPKITTSDQQFAGRALKVSFDRPFYQDWGMGQFWAWEYPMVRWLEQKGYDVSYVSDVDTHRDVGTLLGHSAIIYAGHDEYWSKETRDNIENAVAHGVNLAVFAANTAYWQVRYEPGPHGSNRVVACYRYPNTMDPEMSFDPSRTTTKWREQPVNRPESALLGATYSDGNWQPRRYEDAPFVITTPDHWIYAETGATDGTSIPGIVGYEYDRVYGTMALPFGMTVLSTSPTVNNTGGAEVSNATISTAASGAQVFNAGTIDWSWGLDNVQVPHSTWSGRPQVESRMLSTITANILNRFSSRGVPPTATPVPMAAPTPPPTSTVTPRPTATSTAVPTATSTSTPTATPTPRPTATSTPTPVPTVTPTVTVMATRTPAARHPQLVLTTRTLLRVGRAGTLRVSVRADRRPVSHAKVRVDGRNVGMKHVLRVVTGVHGVATFHHLRPSRAGTLVIAVFKHNYKKTWMSLRVRP